jgi:hypothetical protein
LSSAARGFKFLTFFEAEIVTLFRTTSVESLETITIPAFPRKIIIPGPHSCGKRKVLDEGAGLNCVQ